MSPAESLLCSQQTNGCDTPAPCMKPPWEGMGKYICACVCVSLGLWCVGKLCPQPAGHLAVLLFQISNHLNGYFPRDVVFPTQDEPNSPRQRQNSA